MRHQSSAQQFARRIEQRLNILDQLDPPALPRAPLCTWALTTQRPSWLSGKCFSTTDVSEDVVNNSPAGTATP